MKPIIIYNHIDEDGNVSITKDELEKLITEAYEQGRRDGRAISPVYPYPTVPTDPITPVVPSYPYWPIITYADRSEA